MAQDKPRFFPDPFSDQIDLETTIPLSIQHALATMGHKIRQAKIPIGGSQAIYLNRETNVLSAGSDPRKDGMAAGF
jgi:gamma-glutamyltranspeptidase/glutathione hydrolase